MIKINDRYLKLPLIQGGMGVGISLGNLAGNVMKQGAMGTISFAHPGYYRADFLKNSLQANLQAIADEVKKAREISDGNGLLAANIMVASKDYKEYVEAAVKAKVDTIISGAGLPLELPKYVKDEKILLAPIVSSGKACELLARKWDRNYQKIMDFVVIEGSMAGGHLGFKKTDVLEGKCEDLSKILKDVLAVLSPYEDKYQRKIPVFVAGGIFDGKDIAKYLKEQASGVQMGTRFIATYECDADQRFKDMIIDCQKEDIVIVNSPAGLPGRALKNDFILKADNGTKVCIANCFHCLKTCDPSATYYCISRALINAVKGNVSSGLIFVGENAYRVNKMTSVEALINELMEELEKEIGAN